MKRFLVVAVLAMLVSDARAQKIYFIYIQSNNNEAFFIKMGEKVTSSTAAGYLILPKLVDSTYQFTIGRPGQTTAESRFSITINKKDRGFMLRETDGRLSLVDLQTLTTLQPVAAVNTETEIIGKRTDAFTVLLAQAANDPSLLEIRARPAVVLETVPPKGPPAESVVTTPAKPEESTARTPEQILDSAVHATVAEVKPAPPVEQKALVKNDTPAETNVTEPADRQPVELTETVTTAPAEEAPVYKRSTVTRRSESSTSEGFGLTFWDSLNGVTDTIRIVIPNRNSTAQQDRNDGDSKKFLDNIEANTTPGELKTDNGSDPSVAAGTMAATGDVSVAEANDRLRNAEKKRKGCTTEAEEKDFLKLRKNMAAEESDEAMISEAKKAFRKSCYSTEQIKNLSSLFLSASGKYHFFDAAYGHVSNLEQYAALQSELTDDYYLNRFKALIAQ